ncbi:MAG: ribosomal-processing cysteine protease Prp [Eubacterium sp.]|nr:ribosomal-processing cysteine protease Prp [Eubacterium sp.]
MTNITIYRTEDTYLGVEVSGHAGYAEEGEDIVCAGISFFTINLINSLEQIAEDSFSVNIDDNTGYMKVTMSYEDDEEQSYESQILFDSFLLGVEMLEREYNEFVKLEIKEV